MQAGPSKLIAHPHTTMAVQEMPFQIMEDKFDTILDDFADFNSNDWAKILACPSSPSLPEYDDQFLLSWMLWNFAPMRRCRGREDTVNRGREDTVNRGRENTVNQGKEGHHS